ncbi:hypothetical protein ACIA03_29690 [Nocardioides sp. NPDC051685]|uniref:hypothetical protein n=1 Tax=Nocardioides sp. NPDC051685 TaxID=3364334 RepID=UPI0037B357E2
MSDALAVAAEILEVDQVEQVAELGGSRRSVVRRVRAGAETYIVKEYLTPEDMTWRREAAGLEAADGVRAPRLLGVSEDPTIVVMSDLGTGSNVADLLLSADAQAAGAGMVAWAEAIGEMQRHTTGRLDVFREALGDGIRADATAAEIETIARHLRERAAKSDLPWSESVPDALTEAMEPLLAETDQALTPGDPCPDNNLVGPDGLTLLDFEFAEIRHRAWEGAYLHVPWPSCWCCWQVPDGWAGKALGTYVDATYGSAGPPSTFERDLDLATLLWCIQSTTWFLVGALQDGLEYNLDDDRMPGRRTIVLSRLDLVTRTAGPEPLLTWAADVRKELAARWQDRPLRMAPAFR